MGATARMLGVRAGESGRTWLLLAHYASAVAVTIAGKSVRDAYFLTRYSKSALPLMLVATAAAVAATVALYSRLSDRVRARLLLPLSCVAFAGSLALIHLRSEGAIIAFLYVWMEVINVVTALQFWLLAAEVLDSRQARRLFPLIAGGGSLAAIAVGPQLKPFTQTFGSGALLWMVCGLLLLTGAAAVVTTRLPRAPAASAPEVRKPGTRRRPLSPYLRGIAVIAVCASIVAAVMDYQFKIVSSATLRTEADLVGFFGHFYAATGFGTLMLQFVFARRVFQRFGAIAALLFLPLGLGGASVSILLWPVLAGVVAGKFADQTLRYTLHNGGMELLWLPVAPDRRREAKPFVGGSLKSIAEGFAGIGIFVLTGRLDTAQLSIVALAFCGLWIFTVARMRGLYVRELEAAIEKRQLPPEDLEIGANDAVAARVIERVLQNGDTLQRLFALNLIAELPLAPWRSTLQRLLEEAEPEVVTRILEIGGSDRAIVTREYLAAAVTGQGAPAREAIRAAARSGIERIEESIVSRLNDADPAIRAASSVALVRLQNGKGDAARALLRGMLTSSDPSDRAAILQEAAAQCVPIGPEELWKALADPSPAVRCEALGCVAQHPDERYLERVVDSLELPAATVAARGALAAFPAAAVFPPLATRLAKERTVETRRRLVRAMPLCPLPAAYRLLLKQVDERWPVLAGEASESLLAIARRAPPPPVSRTIADERRAALVRASDEAGKALADLPDELESRLLRDHMTHSLRALIPSVMRLAALARPDCPVETCIRIVQNRDLARLPFVLDLLDTLLPAGERKSVWDVVERLSTREPAAGNGSGSGPSTIYGWLQSALYSENDWRAAVALDYVLLNGSREMPLRLDWSRIRPSPLVRESLASRKPRFAAGLIPGSHLPPDSKEHPGMFTTLEKTILLKSVPLFQEIPAEELSRVAQIAEEATFPAGAAIFRDGEYGDCLHVIVSGSVRIHKSGCELAVLTKGAALGEMAVLDNSPRSADGTAIEDTITLRVGRDQFLEVMHTNAGIMHGVIMLLLARLREAGEKLAAAGQTHTP